MMKSVWAGLAALAMGVASAEAATVSYNFEVLVEPERSAGTPTPGSFADLARSFEQLTGTISWDTDGSPLGPRGSGFDYDTGSIEVDQLSGVPGFFDFEVEVRSFLNVNNVVVTNIGVRGKTPADQNGLYEEVLFRFSLRAPNVGQSPDPSLPTSIDLSIIDNGALLFWARGGEPMRTHFDLISLSASSDIDGEVPLPAAALLFPLGLAALGLRKRAA
ncbi:MAG: hypothetical protein V2I43_18340 [Parvularcula sp.]|jgi:hypothetical protein|nr:hypothetical protein [Parvularcula sp.]